MASGTTLGPIGIVPLTLDNNGHLFIYNFVVCRNLKQTLIVGLNFAQCYKIGIDWDVFGTLYFET